MIKLFWHNRQEKRKFTKDHLKKLQQYIEAKATSKDILTMESTLIDFYDFDRNKASAIIIKNKTKMIAELISKEHSINSNIKEQKISTAEVSKKQLYSEKETSPVQTLLDSLAAFSIQHDSLEDICIEEPVEIKLQEDEYCYGILNEMTWSELKKEEISNIQKNGNTLITGKVYITNKRILLIGEQINIVQLYNVSYVDEDSQGVLITKDNGEAIFLLGSSIYSIYLLLNRLIGR